MSAKLSRNHRAARVYGELGFPVFPCAPRGKNPWCKHGEHDATTDLDRIDELWSRCPDANIGFAPGARGMFVVDVDVRHYGDETLRALPPLPHTVTSLTGGGGLHLVFQRPTALATVRCNALRVPGLRVSGIDVKGVNAGYCILPPSIHESGRRYAWEAMSRVDAVAVAAAPAWLIEMIRDGASRPREYAQHTAFVDPDTFLLGRIFRRTGRLLEQIRPGVFAVVCPNEAAHTTKGGRGDTVIFAPRRPGGRGVFYCAHTSACSGVFR